MVTTHVLAITPVTSGHGLTRAGALTEKRCVQTGIVFAPHHLAVDVEVLVLLSRCSPSQKCTYRLFKSCHISFLLLIRERQVMLHRLTKSPHNNQDIKRYPQNP
jgi:hypothetical protein